MDIDPLPATPVGLLTILAQQPIEFHAPDSWGVWAILVCVAGLCLLVSAFVSGSEIAYFGLDSKEIEELELAEDERSRKVCRLLSHSERLLATVLISNNLVNITMVVLLTHAINQTVEFNSEVLNFLIQTVFLTFLLLLFGEIFPKLVARGRTLRWVLASQPGVTFLYNVLGPVAKFMVRSTSIVNRVVTKKQENISTDELEKALEISDLKDDQEKEMLEGILNFGEKEVSDIMIPRVDVTAIEYHDSWSSAVDVILKSGYSRIPVYDTSQDTIRGILYGKDMLPYIGKRSDTFRWQTLIRDPYFVPESRMIDDLLEDFRKKKMHIAIVIDEYGGTRGIVTMEDIIEEIVGEIDDEYDEASSMFKRISDNVYIFDGKTTLLDFFHAVDIDEEAVGDTGDAETIAGLLLEVKGDFPALKEIIEWEGIKFQVLNLERHRITKIKVILPREEKGAADAPAPEEKK